jgi:hypothetical protein
MVTFLGIVLFIAGAVFLWLAMMSKAEWSSYEEKMKQYNEREPDQRGYQPQTPDIFKFHSFAMHARLILIVGLLLSQFNFMFFYAEMGYNYMVQYPNGTQVGITDAGFHLKIYGDVTAWKKYITIKASNKDDKAKYTGRAAAMPIRFADRVTATAGISCRFQLPEDPERFRKLALEFRSLDNLVSSMILPNIAELIENTAYMYEAQEVISGSAADFKFSFKDQLIKGAYSVERKDIRSDENEEIQSDSSRTVDEAVQIQYRVTVRRDGSGSPIRTGNEIADAGLITSQAIVESIDMDPEFDEKLKLQRNEAAKRQLEQQKTKTALDAQQRIIAEGERNKAQKRAEEEVSQVEVLIAIETKKKEEETKKELAKIALETAKFDAQRVKVEADAKRYELTQADGLSEEVKARLDNDLKKTQAMASAFEKANWPRTVVMGADGGSGDAGLLETLIGAKMAEGMMKKNK